MCGRYTLRTPLKDVVELFEIAHYGAGQEQDARPRYNIAPSQQVAAVRFDREHGGRELAWLRWGLVPPWADDPAIGNRLINARAETVATKPAFREAMRFRRCLIPADGFYEWKRDGGRKQPYFIGMKHDGLFAFAGLWDAWRRGESVVESCTIITTDANDLLRPLHQRMPAILDRDAFARWLDPTIEDARLVMDLLGPYPAELQEAHAVRNRVNSPYHDGPDCIEAAEPGKKQGSLFD